MAGVITGLFHHSYSSDWPSLSVVVNFTHGHFFTCRYIVRQVISKEKQSSSVFFVNSCCFVFCISFQTNSPPSTRLKLHTSLRERPTQRIEVIGE